MQGAELRRDPGFGIDAEVGRTASRRLRLGFAAESLTSPQIRVRFSRLVNPGIWRLISRGKFDAVVLYTGYVCATFWIALAAAKWNRIPVFFGTDAHELAPRDHKEWKVWVKKWLWPRLFGLADMVSGACRAGTVALMRPLGSRRIASP